MCCTAGNGFIIVLLSEAGSSEPRITSLPITVNDSSSSGKLWCSLKRQLIPFLHAVFCVLWSPVQTLLNNYLNCVHYDCSVQSWDEFAKVIFVDCSVTFCEVIAVYCNGIDEDTSLKLIFKFLILFCIASIFRGELQSGPNAEPTLFQF